MQEEQRARCWKWALTLVLGIGVALFWGVGYPHALSYQEQYQLFLWSADYFCQRIVVPGGLADYLGEFVVQFYYVPLLRTLGDENVLLSYLVALLLVLAAAAVGGHRANGGYGANGSYKAYKSYEPYKSYKSYRPYRLACWLAVVALLWWAAGPLAWLYVALQVVQHGWRRGWQVLWLLALQLGSYAFLLPQWPLRSVLLGHNYYRIPLELPVMLWVIPLVILLLALTARWMNSRLVVLMQGVLAVGAAIAVPSGYDRDKYELIRQDYLVRGERWDELISRAEHYQVPTAFSCNCVNLALAQKHQLAERMFDFYQSGDDALLMPRLRDLTSNLPTAEAFWRLGMVNSAIRYMTDLQASILNARKSGRMTQRIAEGCIVNGQYRVAEKHLALLRQSLFYRSWAEEAYTYLNNNARVDSHPVWGRLRQLRYRENFLYNYPEMDKMLGILFSNNTQNRMALDYFMGQLLLRGNVQGFRQYMPWVQQHGGYSYMPLGYQDAARFIQSRGQAEGTKYGEYVKRKMKTAQ